MRTTLIIIIIHLWICCLAQVGNIQSGLKTAKPYDTIFLKNDYKLIFATTDELRLLRLMGRGIDTIIFSRNIKASENKLGRLRADFDDYFALYYGADEDRPWVKIFRKETGKLMATGIVIDFDSTNQMIYYLSLEGVKNMEIFIAKTGRIESFAPPHTPCLWWNECIVSTILTDKELTMVYAGFNNKRETKVYVRKKD